MEKQAPALPATAAPHNRAHITRRIGAIVIAFAAVVVMVAMGPKDTVTTGDIAYVLAGDSINQKSATGAPQQTVVNGWTARDLLELMAKQGVEARDPRPAALLTLLVLGLALALATSSPGMRQDDAGPSTASPMSPDTPTAFGLPATQGP